jgi:hypothetical protein
MALTCEFTLDALTAYFDALGIPAARDLAGA